MPLDAQSLARVRRLWATLAGADAFPERHTRVVTNAESHICPRGWSGVVAIRDGILATVPDAAQLDALARRLDGLEPFGDWAVAFADASECRGPAQLAYADRVTGDVDRALQQFDVKREEVAAFVAAVPVADREEATVEESMSPLMCVCRNGAIVAAAGYRVWLDEMAHLSVLVDPAHRNAGLATTVARAATAHALDAGLVAQWRARRVPSRAVARKLGYVELGQQISIRL